MSSLPQQRTEPNSGDSGESNPPTAVPIEGFQKLLESFPGMWLVLLPNDPIFTVAAASEAYARAAAIQPGEFRGRGFFDVFPGRSRIQDIRASLVRVLGQKIQDEIPAQTYDIHRAAPHDVDVEKGVWKIRNSPVMGANGGIDYILHVIEDVTGSASSRNTLSEGETRYRKLFEAIRDGILIVNEEGRYVEVNDSLCRILKSTRGRLIGAHFSDFIPAGYLEEAESAFAALRVGGNVPVEFPMRALDGTVVHLEWNSTSQYLPGLYFCSCRDISQRKRDEAAVLESERQLRTMVDSIPNLAWMAEADGYIFWYNRRWYEYTGTTPEQMKGWGWQSVHEPTMLAGVMERWQNSIRTGETFEMEFPLRAAGGEFRWFLTRVTPVRNPDGSVARWFGTNTDVNELKRAEEERQQLLAGEQEARRSAELLNHVGQLLAAELDLSRLVQAVTDLATKLIGAQFGALFHAVRKGSEESRVLYSLSGASAEAFAKFPLPRDTAVFGPTFRGEGVIRSGDITKDPRYGKNAPYHGMPEGHLPVRSYLAVPVVSRSGEVLGGLFFGHSMAGMFTERDEHLIVGIAAQAAIAMDNAGLFEQVRLERLRVEEANKALRRANADLEQFAYSASHDLQEPLRMVALYSEMLKRKYGGKLGPQAEQYISYTVEGATRMEHLLQDLLAFTRASVVAEEPAEILDSNEACERAVANLQTSIEESGAVITRTTLPRVKMHQVHLEQVFQNLIGNAIKYRSDQAPRIAIGAEQRENEWIFSVKDNGIGIDPRYKEQIFGIFKRLHTAVEYSGTGMGLAICERIIERYCGRIWVESEPGKGSTFLFALPDPAAGGDE